MEQSTLSLAEALPLWRHYSWVMSTLPWEVVSLYLQAKQEGGLICGHRELCVNGYPLCFNSLSLGPTCDPAEGVPSSESRSAWFFSLQSSPVPTS